MLAKRSLIRACIQKVFTPSLLQHSISSYPIRRNFCKAESESMVQDKSDDPKWMRFFRGIEPNPIDLERAVKNDNVELLNNYVKMNYLGFNFTQLSVVLGSLNKSYPISIRVFNEAKMRVLADKYESNKKVIFKLFSGGKDHLLKDEMMKRFILTEIDKYFDQYNHIEQAEIVHFMFEVSQIKTERLLQYLSFYKEILEEGKTDEYFKGLSMQKLLVELNVFQAFYEHLTPESFNKLIDKRLLDSLTNRVQIYFI